MFADYYYLPQKFEAAIELVEAYLRDGETRLGLTETLVTPAIWLAMRAAIFGQNFFYELFTLLVVSS